MPGLAWPIVRPKEVHLTGYDLDGNEVSIEADELLARLFQHELDHLDGVLLLDHLDGDQRKQAKRSCGRSCMNGALGPGRAPARARTTCSDRCALHSSARRRWPCRRCGRLVDDGHDVGSWSPAPTSAGGGAGRSCPAR